LLALGAVLIRASQRAEHARGEVAVPDEIPVGQALAGGAVRRTVLESKPHIPFLAKAAQPRFLLRFAYLAYRPPRVIEGDMEGVPLSFQPPTLNLEDGSLKRGR